LLFSPVPIEARGALTESTALNPTPIDPTGSRFARLAQNAAAGVVGVVDRPSYFAGIRSHARTSLRGEFGPVPFNDDPDSPVTPPRFTRLEPNDAPRPWHRLRRRPEPAPDDPVLANTPSADTI
jgi:hypothetical protein